MQEGQSRAKRVLYTVIVIACVLAILRVLYDMGYSIYMRSEFYNDWKVWEKLSYQIFYSKVLKVAGKVFFYSGLVAVFAMWEKPRPTWMFVLLIAAGIIPWLVRETNSQLMLVNFDVWDHLSAYSIIQILLWVIWTLAKWIVIAKLYTLAEIKAKPVLALYMIIIGMGILGSVAYMFYGLISTVIFTLNYYISQAAAIILYVMTIVYLKKKLGDNMPFTNTMRFIKKECINRAPVE